MKISTISVLISLGLLLMSVAVTTEHNLSNAVQLCMSESSPAHCLKSYGFTCARGYDGHADPAYYCKTPLPGGRQFLVRLVFHNDAWTLDLMDVSSRTETSNWWPNIPLEGDSEAAPQLGR